MRRILLSGATLAGTTAALALPGAASAESAGSVSPETVRPGGRVTFSATCTEGVKSAEVAGATLGLSARIPMEAGKATGTFSAVVDIPATVTAGTYSVSIDCADGTSSVVRLVVSPTGGVPTGGGSTAQGPNRTLMAAGGGLLLLGAAGALALRRRSV
ncbi:hypothetical protein [Dactylosporangium aurantiacum]|uniref:hypothetical protein n=1 Tax=Dactylosporangium aurantiacum TaxID=35754 RepID=UPI00069416B2|nr:hypothetical protein [Dactylosporangium aurantiacum]MDG6110456.1 hypothetical protein [Dactylosporangium aurantiacum]